MPFDVSSIGSIITAIGALGTSSAGIVDATKVFGGASVAQKIAAK